MKRSTHPIPLGQFSNAAWRSAEWGALVVTVAVLVGLIVAPEQTLTIAWFGIVPVLPASFLVNAGLWRGVCPIATAGTVFSSPRGRALDGSLARWATGAGILLLILLVPTRRFALNQDGMILAATLVAIVTAAAVLGSRYRVKGGFCNALCPILPVEKLYGQSPLVYVRNARCVPCTACTARGCLDLGPQRALIGDGVDTSSRKWLRTQPGLFSVFFPGFVFGYFQTIDGVPGDALEIYAVVLGWALVGMLVFATLVYLLDPPVRVTVAVLAAVAAGTYYWYAGPASADAFDLAPEIGRWIRWTALSLVIFWLVVALDRARRHIPTESKTSPDRNPPPRMRS